MTDPVLFVLAVLAVLGTPGPTNTLLATSGALGGIGRSLPLLLAEAAGYMISVSLVGALLGPVVASQPVLGAGLKIAMALYLGLLALRLWRTASEEGKGARGIGFATVFVTTLLNPKALIFALVIIPFGKEGLAFYLLGFIGLVFLVGFSWILLGALAGAVAARSQRALIARLASVALAVFAGIMVASLLR